MDLGLEGKVAFITGAGHGIGRQFALAFAREGAAVAIAEINAQWAKQTAGEITGQGGRALAVACDVSDSSQVNAAIQRTAQEFGRIDILINDAVSPLLTGTIEELGDEERKLKEMLESKKGEAVSREEIAKHVWPDTDVEEVLSNQLIDKAVLRIRAHLHDDPRKPRRLITAGEFGYLLV